MKKLIIVLAVAILSVSGVYFYGRSDSCREALHEAIKNDPWGGPAGLKSKLLARIVAEPNPSLLFAARFGRKEVMEALINHGADPNFASVEEGITPLMLAAESLQWEAVTFLIERGAKASALDRYGQSPLIYSITAKVPNDQAAAHISNILIKGGTDPNTVGTDGYSPLMKAASKAMPKTVEALVLHGANREFRSKEGYTSLDLAKKRRDFSEQESQKTPNDAVASFELLEAKDTVFVLESPARKPASAQ